MKLKLAAAFLGAAALFFSGCATNAYTGETQASKTGIGAGIGALAGAAIGAASSSKKDRKKGILIGAASGAAVGGGIGAYMDYQNKKLRQELQSTGVSVTKNADNTITLNMPGDITFKSGKSDLQTNFIPVLNSVAKVLKEYNKTTIVVSGHTDNTGSESVNLPLSQQRALSVANYLSSKGVAASRFQTKGYGSKQPVASNKTPAGRAQNRRVVIKLTYVE